MASGTSVRPAATGDQDGIGELLATAFGGRLDAEERGLRQRLFPVERSLVAVDAGRVVGHTVDITMTVTVPGDRTVRAAGVSAVAVAPTHRRRGLLRALYTAQHARTEADGLPLTIFTASEGTIYGRFGYDPTVTDLAVSLDRRRVAFRPTTPDPGGVAMSTLDEAAPHMRAVYERWQHRTSGAQERPEAKWAMVFADPEGRRSGASSVFVLTHPDGYALYQRRRDGQESVATVTEIRAVTPPAHAALWRVLLGLDLVDRVEAVLAEDDPLPYLFTDPRTVRVTNRGDALWARVMDVPAALTARGYDGDLDTVIEVHDPFRAAGGRFALRVRDGAAECSPTTRPAELGFDINVLGALYFGGHRARALAAAHRIEVGNAAALRAFDAAFATERAPELGWFF
ncbi:GNAT family N-acetyltransferase [Nocardia sp. AG03]|uniref:GNAT family N-acetyltransferase n=1 Tax=Nocardia sp. AG03 TaxID=3025312 RepID=UPI002418709C|nr:GNAT family N-acetyltransferase [Nocardia sp. AG03]